MFDLLLEGRNVYMFYNCAARSLKFGLLTVLYSRHPHDGFLDTMRNMLVLQGIVFLKRWRACSTLNMQVSSLNKRYRDSLLPDLLLCDK